MGGSLETPNAFRMALEARGSFCQVAHQSRFHLGSGGLVGAEVSQDGGYLRGGTPGGRQLVGSFSKAWVAAVRSELPDLKSRAAERLILGRMKSCALPRLKAQFRRYMA